MLGFGGNNKKNGPIGLAVTRKDVRLAQRLAGGGFVLEAEPLSPDVDPQGPAFSTEVCRAVSTVLRRGVFTSKQAVSALPVDALRYKTLRLPPMPPDELAQAVAWEAKDRLQLSDDQVLQFFQAGDVQQGGETRQEVILLAASKQEVYDHAIAIKRSGLMPIAVDATAAALARVFGKEGKATAVIHLTDGSAQIIGTQDAQVIFDKPVDLNFNNGSLDTDSLAREATLCLRYLSVSFGIHKPDTVWICGEHVDEEVAETIGQSLRVKLKTPELALAERQVMCEPEDAARWAVAIGLAERSAKGSAHRGAA